MARLWSSTLAVLLAAAPLWGQALHGSLVVWIVSERSDYVVIGAESRSVDSTERVVSDQDCKIISLGGDTLFCETGSREIASTRRASWNSLATARSIYASSPNRDPVSLRNAWSEKAGQWLSRCSEQLVRQLAHPPNGVILFGGFINRGRNGTLSFCSEQLKYDPARHDITGEPITAAPGQVGASGRALGLVTEFIDGTTYRAIRARKLLVNVPALGIDPEKDAIVVRATITFAMANAVGQDKAELGGDIDVAIIRNDRTIQWVARKPGCSREDYPPIGGTTFR